MNKDMIIGNPTKSLILFAIPMILGQMFQQIYSLADTLIVGRTLGQGPLGAVGSAVSICWVYISIATGLGIGCSVVISQLFGAGTIRKMRTAINTSIVSMVGLSILFLAVGLVTCSGMMVLMNTPAELLEHSRTYYLIYIIGFPGLFLYNISNSIFNALGKSRIPLYFLAGSACLNIGLDLWFILGFGWGVAGAAIATIVSQYIAAALSFFVLLHYIRREFAGAVSREEDSDTVRLFDAHMLKGIARVAIPTMVTQTIMSVGLMTLQSLINRFGMEVMAGYTAASKIDMIAIVPMIQIGNAVSTFAAQNVGAQQYDRVTLGLRTALFMTGAVAVTLAVVMFIWCKPIVNIFMDASSSADAIAYGADYLKIVCAFYLLMGFMNNINGVLRGTGDVAPTMVSLVSNFVCRIAFAYIMTAMIPDPKLIAWSNPIGWFIGLAVCAIRFRTGKWRTKSVVRTL